MSNDKLLRIENKIDKISDHISSIDITISKQHVSLQDHIRRTELLEEKLQPVERHVNMVNGAVKLILVISAIAGIYLVFK